MSTDGDELLKVFQKNGRCITPWFEGKGIRREQPTLLTQVGDSDRQNLAGFRSMMYTRPW